MVSLLSPYPSKLRVADRAIFPSTRMFGRADFLFERLAISEFEISGDFTASIPSFKRLPNLLDGSHIAARRARREIQPGSHITLNGSPFAINCECEGFEFGARLLLLDIIFRLDFDHCGQCCSPRIHPYAAR